jgi:TonB family protein
MQLTPDEIRQGLAAGATPAMSVEVFVETDGSVTRASMYKSSGSDVFDNAAMSAARRSVYRPKFANCKPAMGVYLMPFIVGQ